MKIPGLFNARLFGPGSMQLKVLFFDLDFQGGEIALDKAKNEFPELVWFQASLNRTVLENHLEFEGFLNTPDSFTMSRNYDRGGALYCKIGIAPFSFDTFELLVYHLCRFWEPLEDEQVGETSPTLGRHEALVGFVKSIYQDSEIILNQTHYAGQLWVRLPPALGGKELSKILGDADALLRHYYPMPPEEHFSKREQAKAISMWRQCCRGNHSLILSPREGFI